MNMEPINALFFSAAIMMAAAAFAGAYTEQAKAGMYEACVQYHPPKECK